MEYRVINIVWTYKGQKTYTYSVSNLKDAKSLIDGLATFQLDLGDNVVGMNMFDIEEFDEQEQEWLTWYDNQGQEYNETEQENF